MTIPTTENIKLWFNPGFVRDKMLTLRAEIDRLTAELAEARRVLALLEEYAKDDDGLHVCLESAAKAGALPKATDDLDQLSR